MRKEPDVPFVNDSGEVIPPGALMVPGDTFDDDGAVSVTKPTAASMPGLLVNGEFSVGADAKGSGSFGPLVALAYDPESEPEAGDTYGSEIGSWLGKKGNYGWVVYGGGDADFGIVNAVRDGTGAPASGGGGSGVGGCGWLAAMIAGESAFWMTVPSALGFCDCIDTTQRFLLTHDGTAWTPSEAYNDPFLFAACTGDFSVSFVNDPCGMPCLALTTTTGGTGGETTYYLQWDECDAVERSVTFAGAGVQFCDGASGPICGPNEFVVKLQCATVCPNTACPTLPAVMHAVFTGGDCACTVPGTPIEVGPNPLNLLAGGWQHKSNACVGWPGNGSLPGFYIGFSCIADDGSITVSVIWNKPGTSVGFTGSANVNTAPNTCDPPYIEFTLTAIGGGPSPIAGGACATTNPTKLVLML